jgi:N6-adenosine-specific RNA methylase IME4
MQGDARQPDLTSAPQETTLPALIDAAQQALAEAKDFGHVLTIRDRAEALRVFAEKLGMDTRKLSVIQVRAEVRLGEELKRAKLGPGRPRKGARTAPALSINKVLITPLTDRLTLKALGISKKESSRWQQVAGLPVNQREHYLATADEVTTAGLLETVKQQRHAARESKFGERARAAAAKLGTRLYGVIYADPPWRFDPRSRATGMEPTWDELKAIEVPAAEDCVLFLWATAPMLEEALLVMSMWQFFYCTEWIWLKPKPGTGYWLRNRHESLLIGVRGTVPAPAVSCQLTPSVIEADGGRHGEKPERFAKLIEAMFPTTPRLEMFARAPRPGWDVWGNETEGCPANSNRGRSKTSRRANPRMVT